MPAELAMTHRLALEALHAARSGDRDLLAVLLEVDGICPVGCQRLLETAARFGHVEVVKLLTERGVVSDSESAAAPEPQTLSQRWEARLAM